MLATAPAADKDPVKEKVVARAKTRFPPVLSGGKEVATETSDDFFKPVATLNLEGLSHTKVAERMSRGEGDVRMLWVRALARLRREMESLS